MNDQGNYPLNDPALRDNAPRHTEVSRVMTKLYRIKSIALRRWWMALLVILAAVAVQGGIIWFAPSEFVSVGRMIVNIKLSIPEGNTYSEELSNFIGTQAALMQSGTVVSRAHQKVAQTRPDLGFKMINLSVDVQPRTSIFVLRAVGADPLYVEAFLQGCMDEYINLKKDMRAQASDSTLAGLTEQVMSLERELRNYDEEIAAFQSSNSVVLLQEQGNTVGATLSELRRQLAPLKSEYELLKVLTPEQNLDMSRDKIGGARNPEDAVISDPEILRASQQIMQLKAQQQDLGQYLRPAHPKMIGLTEDIERREKMLEYYRQQVTDQSRKEYSRSLDVSKKQMEIKLSTLTTQMENLQKEIQQWDDKVLNINRQMAEYQKIKAKQQRTQNLYDKLLSTMQTLDVNKGVTPENVTVMEKACKAFAERQEAGKSLAIAAGIGIFLGIIILFLLDRLDDRMNTITEFKDSFDENVLAQVPREKAKGRKQEIELLRNEDDRHAFAEAFRSLRSSLLYMHNPEQKPRLMLVTSSVPNDGKSVVSSNLAITLANAGSRVLLVDADLRKGVLHERFQIQEKPGLSEVLDQGVKWEDCVRPTEIKRLSLLARGAVTHNSSELFISEVTKVFLKAAVAQYDYVLVDTAPVMAADDVTSIAPLLDGIIFVIRAEQTSARVARASLDLLMQRQARILGVVFNAVKATSSDYYYYYKYRDYYHQPGKPAKSARPTKAETPVKT